MTPREQIIAAAKAHLDTVRKSAMDDIATAKEMLSQVASSELTERLAAEILKNHQGNAGGFVFDHCIFDPLRLYRKGRVRARVKRPS
jgi:hypothetical protein